MNPAILLAVQQDVQDGLSDEVIRRRYTEPYLQNYLDRARQIKRRPQYVEQHESIKLECECREEAKRLWEAHEKRQGGQIDTEYRKLLVAVYGEF